MRDFLHSIAPLVGVQDPDRELAEVRRVTDEHGRRHITFRQAFLGIPVRRGELSVHLRSDGAIYSCGGSTPVRPDDWAARVTAAAQQARIAEREAASAAAGEVIRRTKTTNAEIAGTTAHKFIITKEPWILWEVDVIVTGGRWSVDVDAITGNVIGVQYTAESQVRATPGDRDVVQAEQPVARADSLPAGVAPARRTRVVPPPPVIASLSEETGKIATAAALPPPESNGTTTLLSETFEGTFPTGAWQVWDDNGSSYGDVYWDDSSYRPYAGSWSAWCADGGANRVSAGGTYPANMDAWMTWGPFSLSDASGGSMTLKYWLESESGYDYLRWYVSVDGYNYYGYETSGYTAGWVTTTLDFTNVPYIGNISGSPNVWVAVVFTSDGTQGYRGAYVDNIVVQKTTAAAADLSLQYVDAPSGTFAPGASLVVQNSTTNIGGLTSPTYRMTFYASTNTIISSTDTSLGYVDRTALGAGANHTYNTTLTLPSTLAAGAYYIGAILTVSDANSGNNTNYDSTPITVAVAQGGPAIGTGYGVLGNALSHIDTFYDTSYFNEYLLRDITRRSATNPHNHNGRMGSSSVIETGVMSYGVTSTASDSNNVWDWSGDAAPADQQVATGKVYDYLNRQLSLNGIDAAGGSMLSTTDVDWLESVNCSSPNAYWDGQRVNICAGVSGYLPFSGALDVVAHEWGHAVTEKTAVGRVGPLVYAKESGALNEAFSDWMGNATEQWYGETNWTLGEGIYTIRSMSSPRSYSQPDTYGGTYWRSTTSCTPVCDPSDPNYNDCCGVHTNSGVPNKMFYLLSQGSASETGGVFNGVAVSGVGVQTAMAIALDANRYHWPADATFAMARAGMIDSAQAWGQTVVNSVSNAWAAVGVGQVSCTGFSISPTSLSTNAAAGTRSVTITGSPANCNGAWTAVSNVSWMSVTPANGTKDGSVTVAWTQNGSASRSGTATIAGKTFTLTQSGAPACTSFSLAPTSASSSFYASSAIVSVIGSPAGCIGGSWTASPNQTWIGVSPSSGSGSASVTVSWSENTSTSSRTGSARIAALTFSVSQGGRTSTRRSAIRGDFNNDGRTELLWRNSSTGAVAMWELSGRTLVNGAGFRTLSDSNWKIIGFGDFNGDSYDDVFLRNASTGATSFWLMRGRTVTAVAGTSVPDMNWQMHAIGDFNGDHKDELIWRNASSGAVAMWELNGATLLNGAIFATVAGSAWQIQLAADFNGDGKDELLWRNTSTGAMAMWDMQGRTLLNGANFATVSGSQWQIAAAGDYNGDGKADLFWRDSAGNVAMWEMNHRTVTNSAGMGSVATSWVPERSGDFTSDGKDEIIWRNSSTGAVAMWELNGHTLLNGAAFYTVSDLSWKIVPRGGVRPLLNSQ